MNLDNQGINLISTLFFYSLGDKLAKMVWLLI